MKSIKFDLSEVKLLTVARHSVLLDINGKKVHCYWRVWNRLVNNPDIEVFVEETDMGDWLSVPSRF